MGVLHSATRSLAAAGLLVMAAGCGNDSNAPDAPFSAEGTSADVQAIGESFEAPAFEAYVAASADINAVVGGTAAAAAVRAMPSAALGSRTGAMRYASLLARHYRSGGLRPSLSAASVPAEYLGVTFVYDVSTDTYVQSDLSGAPSNGVRFLLYSVNPVTGQPTEPLVEVGYVDFTSSETASSATARAVVVSGGVTFLDYTVVVSGTASSLTVSVGGFATNGTDRVNFDLETTLSGDAQDNLTLAIDNLLVVPTRGGFRMDIESVATGVLTETPTATIELAARGDHGTVTIDGTETNGVGSFEVEVNGELFATITLDGEGLPEIVGATGQPLTQAEQAALLAIWAMFAEGFDFFEDLTDPIA